MASGPDKETLAIVRAIKEKHNLLAFDYQKLTVTGASAQSLTVPTGATYAEIRVESATTTGVVMRYLMIPNVSPTTTDGMALSYLDLFDINTGDNLGNFKVIAVSGSHTIHVQYYK
jgi:hypothetical protein